MQKDRYFSLDFVRGISVLLIIFSHYNSATARIISNNITLSKYWVYAGPLGVSMFFILSGAALTLSTQNNYSFISFYRKRFLAIFPVFWATYILIVFAHSIIFQSSLFVGRNPLTFILTILGVDGFLLYKIPNYYLIGEWFLGCIIILYILFPAIRFLFNKNKHLLLVVSFVFCILLEKVYNLNMQLDRFPLFRIFEFIFGMYFVTVYNSNSHRQNYILLLMAAIGISVFFSFKVPGNLVFFPKAILGILFFIFLSTFSKIFEKYIPQKAITFLSKYSYTAFLLHHYLLNKIVTSPKSFLLSSYNNYAIFFTTLFVIYLFSYVLYSSLRWLLRNPLLI